MIINRPKLLIATQSSTEGYNYKLVEKIYNLVGSSGYEITVAGSIGEVDPKEKFDKYIFVIPEWNGSFPYTFKKFVDESGYPSVFEEKKVLLIGTSTSTTGNVMGIEQFRGILSWVGAQVYPKFHSKPRIDLDQTVDERLSDLLIQFSTNF